MALNSFLYVCCYCIVRMYVELHELQDVLFARIIILLAIIKDTQSMYDNKLHIPSVLSVSAV